MVEYPTVNRRVRVRTPLTHKLYGGISLFGKVADCESVEQGSIPDFTQNNGTVTQLVECLVEAQEVAGSTPVCSTKHISMQVVKADGLQNRSLRSSWVRILPFVQYNIRMCSNGKMQVSKTLRFGFKT